MVRHPWDFTEYSFGIYWDSWAHVQQMDTHGRGIEKVGHRWKTAPMGGETAYDWGKYEVQPGESPTDTLRDPGHRDFFIDTVRWLHCNHVGWVANYDHDDPEARKGAEEAQKALGYRFVIDSVRYPAQTTPGEEFQVSFSVRNTGSIGVRLKKTKWFGYRDPTHKLLLSCRKWINIIDLLDLVFIGGDGLWDVPYFKYIPRKLQFPILLTQVIAAIRKLKFPIFFSENLYFVFQKAS